MEKNKSTKDRLLQKFFEIPVYEENIKDGIPATRGKLVPFKIHCDRFLEDPEAEVLVQTLLAETLKERKISYDGLALVELGGILIGHTFGRMRNLPRVIVRKNSAIEGAVKRAQGCEKVLLVEDVITYGMTIQTAWTELLENNIACDLCITLFAHSPEYVLGLFATTQGPDVLICITMDEVLNFADTHGLLSEKVIEEVKKYRENPKAWSDTRLRNAAVE